jgi:hypothetical protein
MKNYILIFAFLFCATSATMADGNQCEGVQIPLTIKKDNNSGNSEHPRTPLRLPAIYLNGHTLFFYSDCEYTTVEILNESREVICNIVVIDVPEDLILPENLSGTYEIRVLRGNITFFGYIEL